MSVFPVNVWDTELTPTVTVPLARGGQVTRVRVKGMTQAPRAGLDAVIAAMLADPARGRLVARYMAEEGEEADDLTAAMFPQVREKGLGVYNEALHPRSQDGKFIPKAAIARAARDPRELKRLQQITTHPEERKKLHAAVQAVQGRVGKRGGGFMPDPIGRAVPGRQSVAETANHIHQLRAEVGDNPPNADHLRRLAALLAWHSVSELRELKNHLGVQVSGDPTKEAAVGAIASRALTWRKERLEQVKAQRAKVALTARLKAEGHTGTDEHGREWQNGQMVSGKKAEVEEPHTPMDPAEFDRRMAEVDPRDSGRADVQDRTPRMDVDTGDEAMEERQAAGDRRQRMMDWAADRPDSEPAADQLVRANDRVRRAGGGEVLGDEEPATGRTAGKLGDTGSPVRPESVPARVSDEQAGKSRKTKSEDPRELLSVGDTAHQTFDDGRTVQVNNEHDAQLLGVSPGTELPAPFLRMRGSEVNSVLVHHNGELRSIHSPSFGNRLGKKDQSPTPTPQPVPARKEAATAPADKAKTDRVAAIRKRLAEADDMDGGNVTAGEQISLMKELDELTGKAKSTPPAGNPHDHTDPETGERISYERAEPATRDFSTPAATSLLTSTFSGHGPGSRGMGSGHPAAKDVVERLMADGGHPHTRVTKRDVREGPGGTRRRTIELKDQGILSPDGEFHTLPHSVAFDYARHLAAGGAKHGRVEPQVEQPAAPAPSAPSAEQPSPAPSDLAGKARQALAGGRSDEAFMAGHNLYTAALRGEHGKDVQKIADRVMGEHLKDPYRHEQFLKAVAGPADQADGQETPSENMGGFSDKPNVPETPDSSPAAPVEKPKKSRQELEDQLQMYRDNADMLKSQGKPVPQSWHDGMARIRAELDGDNEPHDGTHAGAEVFGHPAATVLGGDKYRNLVPIKVQKGSDMTRRLRDAQAHHDELATKIALAEAVVQGRIKATPAKKKEAKSYLSSQQYAEESTVRDLLRNETLPELNRLHKLVGKKPDEPEVAAGGAAAQPEVGRASTAEQPVSPAQAEPATSGGTDGPTPAASRKTAADLPHPVRSRVEAAIGQHQKYAEALEQGRRADRQFAGDGRYERDAHDSHKHHLEAGDKTLNEFRKMAPGNGFDPEAIIRELGGGERPEMSKAGHEYDQPVESTRSAFGPPPADRPSVSQSPTVGSDVVSHPILDRAAEAHTDANGGVWKLNDQERFELATHLDKTSDPGIVEAALRGENIVPRLNKAIAARKPKLDEEKRQSAQAENQKRGEAAEAKHKADVEKRHANILGQAKKNPALRELVHTAGAELAKGSKAAKERARKSLFPQSWPYTQDHPVQEEVMNRIRSAHQDGTLRELTKPDAPRMSFETGQGDEPVYPSAGRGDLFDTEGDEEIHEGPHHKAVNDLLTAAGRRFPETQIGPRAKMDDAHGELAALDEHLSRASNVDGDDPDFSPFSRLAAEHADILNRVDAGEFDSQDHAFDPPSSKADEATEGFGIDGGNIDNHEFAGHPDHGRWVGKHYRRVYDALADDITKRVMDRHAEGGPAGPDKSSSFDAKATAQKMKDALQSYDMDQAFSLASQIDDMNDAQRRALMNEMGTGYLDIKSQLTAHARHLEKGEFDAKQYGFHYDPVAKKPVVHPDHVDTARKTVLDERSKADGIKNRLDTDKSIKGSERKRLQQKVKDHTKSANEIEAMIAAHERSKPAVGDSSTLATPPAATPADPLTRASTDEAGGVGDRPAMRVERDSSDGDKNVRVVFTHNGKEFKSKWRSDIGQTDEQLMDKALTEHRQSLDLNKPSFRSADEAAEHGRKTKAEHHALLDAITGGKAKDVVADFEAADGSRRTYRVEPRHDGYNGLHYVGVYDQPGAKIEGQELNPKYDTYEEAAAGIGQHLEDGKARFEDIRLHHPSAKQRFDEITESKSATARQKAEEEEKTRLEEGRKARANAEAKAHLEANYGKEKLKKGSIDLVQTDGTTKTVKGEHVGPFLIHKDVDTGRGWSISHTKSGMGAVGSKPLDSKDQAHIIASMIGAHGNWDFDGKTKKPDRDTLQHGAKVLQHFRGGDLASLKQHMDDMAAKQKANADIESSGGLSNRPYQEVKPLVPGTRKAIESDISDANDRIAYLKKRVAGGGTPGEADKWKQEIAKKEREIKQHEKKLAALDTSTDDDDTTGTPVPAGSGPKAGGGGGAVSPEAEKVADMAASDLGVDKAKLMKAATALAEHEGMEVPDYTHVSEAAAHYQKHHLQGKRPEDEYSPGSPAIDRAKITEPHLSADKPTGPWHGGREKVFEQMRKIEEEHERHRRNAQQFAPKQGQIGIGSQDFDHHLKAEVAMAFNRALRQGKNPQQATEYAKEEARATIKNWNTKGSKQRASISGNHEYQRDAGSGDTYAEDLGRRFAGIGNPSAPTPPAGDTGTPVPAENQASRASTGEPDLSALPAHVQAGLRDHPGHHVIDSDGTTHTVYSPTGEKVSDGPHSDLGQTMGDLMGAGKKVAVLDREGRGADEPVKPVNETLAQLRDRTKAERQKLEDDHQQYGKELSKKLSKARTRAQKDKINEEWQAAQAAHRERATQMSGRHMQEIQAHPEHQAEQESSKKRAADMRDAEATRTAGAKDAADQSMWEKVQASGGVESVRKQLTERLADAEKSHARTGPANQWKTESKVRSAKKELEEFERLVKKFGTPPADDQDDGTTGTPAPAGGPKGGSGGGAGDAGGREGDRSPFQDIEDEAKRIADGQAELKNQSMVYQREAKQVVADHYGLPFDQVNVAYPEWEKLRNRYTAETGRKPEDGPPVIRASTGEPDGGAAEPAISDSDVNSSRVTKIATVFKQHVQDAESGKPGRRDAALHVMNAFRNQASKEELQSFAEAVGIDPWGSRNQIGERLVAYALGGKESADKELAAQKRRDERYKAEDREARKKKAAGQAGGVVADEQTKPVSDTVSDTADVPQPSPTPADPNSPYTLAEHDATTERLQKGDITPDELRSAHARLQQHRDAVMGELKKYTVPQLKKLAGTWHAADMNKGELLDYVHKQMGDDLVPRGARGGAYMIGPGYDVRKHQASQLEKVTNDHIRGHAEAVQKARDERKQQVEEYKAKLENPQTLDDYKSLIRTRGGFDKLTADEQAKHDELHAEARRGRSMAERQEKAKIAGFSGGEQAAGGIEIVDGHHQKRDMPTHTVTVANRLGDEKFQEALSAAKRLGGSYVNAMTAKRYGATPGFQFFDKAKAEQFAAVLRGESVDRSADVAGEMAERQQNRAGSLSEKAESLIGQGEDSLGRERRTNTHRQAAMAASAEAQAREKIATGKTLQRIGDGQADGTLKHLNGIRSAEDLHTLDRALRFARYERMRQAKGPDGAELSHREREAMQHEPHGLDDFQHLEYPHPSAHQNELQDIGRMLADEPGLKRFAEKMKKEGDPAKDVKFQGSVGGMKANGGTLMYDHHFRDHPEFKYIAYHMRGDGDGDKAVRVHTSHDWRLAQAASAQGEAGRGHFHTADKGKSWARTPEEAVLGAIRRGNTLDHIDAPRERSVKFTDADDIEALRTAARKLRNHPNDRLRRIGQSLKEKLEHHDRLKRADIHSLPELRAALREYLPLQQAADKEDPVKKAERELKGRDIPGFFPTPRPAVEEMLDRADIQPGHTVLEPSAGKGDILDALRERHPDAQAHALEYNSTLRDILQKKGHNVVGHDALDHVGQYDRIVMNPPFENSQDVTHLQKAYQLTKPGGRIVAIMSEGPFSRSDAKSQSFREWLESVGGVHDPMPEGSFMGNEAFRKTGVRTRMVTIDKPND